MMASKESLTIGSAQVWKDCNTTTRAESFKCETEGHLGKDEDVEHE